MFVIFKHESIKVYMISSNSYYSTVVLRARYSEAIPQWFHLRVFMSVFIREGEINEH